jgi:hypothetical protein
VYKAAMAMSIKISLLDSALTSFGYNTPKWNHWPYLNFLKGHLSNQRLPYHKAQGMNSLEAVLNLIYLE